MSALKEPEIVIHTIFQDYGSDMEEIASCVTAFLDGDCGALTDEDEILGFMRRGIEGKLRHGVYRTSSGGIVHVVGDDEKVMAMPDIIYAQGTRDVDCSINTCTCQSEHQPTP
jgi:hypothetical protein